jgi:transposase
MREIVNAICYVRRGGIAWRPMPDCFPPWRTVYRWFARLRDDGTWETINHHLVMRDRERAGREASPTAAVMDSQSVKTSESGSVRSYDGGKKIKGRKRDALVDTDRRVLKLQAHAADIQDLDGAWPPLRACLTTIRTTAIEIVPHVVHNPPLACSICKHSTNCYDVIEDCRCRALLLAPGLNKIKRGRPRDVGQRYRPSVPNFVWIARGGGGDLYDRGFVARGRLGRYSTSGRRDLAPVRDSRRRPLARYAPPLGHDRSDGPGLAVSRSACRHTRAGQAAGARENQRTYGGFPEQPYGAPGQLESGQGSLCSHGLDLATADRQDASDVVGPQQLGRLPGAARLR